MTRDIFVIGGTTTSVADLGEILRELPGDFPGAVLAVIHVPADYPSILPQMAECASRLEVFEPKDNDKIVPGRVYVASPNFHLLVEKDRVRVCRSPEENLHRPAVDPLFRSAAYYYGPRVTGVLLSKSDSDGTSGLYAIKMKKGIVILRDPDESHMPVMPFSVDRHVEVDYQARLAEIPGLLIRLADGTQRGRVGKGRAHAR